MAHRDTSHSVLVVADGVEQTVDVQMGSGQHTLTALQVLRRYKRRHGGRRQAAGGFGPFPSGAMLTPLHPCAVQAAVAAQLPRDTWRRLECDDMEALMPLYSMHLAGGWCGLSFHLVRASLAQALRVH